MIASQSLNRDCHSMPTPGATGAWPAWWSKRS